MVCLALDRLLRHVGRLIGMYHSHCLDFSVDWLASGDYVCGLTEFCVDSDVRSCEKCNGLLGPIDLMIAPCLGFRDLFSINREEIFHFFYVSLPTQKGILSFFLLLLLFFFF